jgi:hypothetical protein
MPFDPIDYLTRKYSASVWKEWLSSLSRNFPRRGKDTRLTYTDEGVVVSLSDDLLWRHPWSLKFMYVYRQDRNKSADLKGHWEAYIWPGFVNGEDAHVVAMVDEKETNVPLTAETAPGLELSSWRNPLTPGGISATEDGGLVLAPGEGYPKFFEKLGVKPAAKGGPADQASSTFSEDPFRTREIRALDTFLETPRPAVVSEVELLSPSIDGQSIRIQSRIENSFLVSSAVRHTYKATSKYTPLRQPTHLERMMGTAAEPQADQIKMATIWAVSPPDAGPEDEVDASWTLYAQYDVFWNLNHASKQEVPTVPFDPLELRTGLVFGIADQIFAQLLTPTNDAFAFIDAYFGSGDFSGQHWNI